MSYGTRSLLFELDDALPPNGETTPDAGQKASDKRKLFALREFRALHLALAVNWLGVYIVRAAVTFLVYEQTRSVLLSAAAFAVGFLPWVIGGSVLTAVAQRFPARRVLVTGDLLRALVIALLLVPGLPVAVILIVAYTAGLGAPPSQAVRSVLLTQVVGRERLPVAHSANALTIQAAQVVGYLGGSLLAVVAGVRPAFAVAVATCGLSAALVGWGVNARPAAGSGARSQPLREAARGFRLIFRAPALRTLAVAAFALTMFAAVPESLAAAWAAQDRAAPAVRGLLQGWVMAAGPLGFLAGNLLVTHVIGDAWRDRLGRPAGVLSALVLVPVALSPPLPVVAALVTVSGVAQGCVLPGLNSRFVQALPHEQRGSAFHAMQIGIQASQFGSVLATAALAEHFRLPPTVGLWCLGVAVILGVAVRRLPGRKEARAEVHDVAQAATGLHSLEAENRQAAEQALRCAHPLLAAELTAAADRLRNLNDTAPAPRDGPGLHRRWLNNAQELTGHARAALRRNRRRLRRARVAHLLNLPLGREAAENFAVARLSERIARLDRAMASYLPAPGSSSGGAHV